MHISSMATAETISENRKNTISPYATAQLLQVNKSVSALSAITVQHASDIQTEYYGHRSELLACDIVTKCPNQCHQ
jgi:hypothetical protein